MSETLQCIHPVVKACPMNTNYLGNLVIARDQGSNVSVEVTQHDSSDERRDFSLCHRVKSGTIYSFHEFNYYLLTLP
jgi:hypothetical protein